MLDDGVPYKTIIEKLGDSGKHLNENNIGNWRMGGYQDFRKAQLIHERACAQTNAAADILREQGDTCPSPEALQRICREMALLHYMDALLEHGDQIAHESLKKNPAKLITLINACCNMADASIDYEKQQWKWEDRARAAKSSVTTAKLVTNPTSSQTESRSAGLRPAAESHASPPSELAETTPSPAATITSQ